MAFFLNRAPVVFLVLPSDLILDSLPISLSLSLLLEVDLLCLVLKAERLLLPWLPELLSGSLLVVHSVDPSVEAAVRVAQREVFLAHSVREVAVAAFEAASVTITFLAAWRAHVGHRNI